MQNNISDSELDNLFLWCKSITGSDFSIVKDIRIHGRSNVIKLTNQKINIYLKVYSDPEAWQRELFAYKNWTKVFDKHVPKLIDVYSGDPKAILISELVGKALVNLKLNHETEKKIWNDAGKYLKKMHELGKGEVFSHISEEIITADPVDFYKQSIFKLIAKAEMLNVLRDDELSFIKTVLINARVFATEKLVPCHRDYGPDNWIINSDNEWVGVIDFEFANWDLRLVDFARYPHWEWIHKPDLVKSLLNGYNNKMTSDTNLQCYLLRVQYALDAIVWGNENSFFGFANEGQHALNYLEENKPV